MKKIDLDLDKYKGKPLNQMTPKELEALSEPFRESLLLVVKSYQEQFKALSITIEPLLPQIFETQKRMAELLQQSFTPQLMEAMKRSFIMAIDTRRIAEGLFQSLHPSLELYKHSFVDLGTLNSFGRVSQFSNIRLEVKKTRTISGSEAEIQSSATSRTSYRSLKIVQVADVKLIVTEAESRLTEKFSQKFASMEELIKELADNKIKTFPVIIKNIKFDLVTLKLTINNKTIEFSKPSKQTEICNLFFSSVEKVKRKLHIEDILEEYGEILTKDKIKQWNDQFYQAVRHLNTKIAVETGCKEFILYQNQYYLVNPDYLQMF